MLRIILIIIMALLMGNLPAYACGISRQESEPQKVINTATFVGKVKVLSISHELTPKGSWKHMATVKPLKAYTKPYDSNMVIVWFDNSCNWQRKLEKNKKYEMAIFCNDKGDCGDQPLSDEIWENLRKGKPITSCENLPEGQCIPE